jgi:hypothetical protein
VEGLELPVGRIESPGRAAEFGEHKARMVAEVTAGCSGTKAIAKWMSCLAQAPASDLRPGARPRLSHVHRPSVPHWLGRQTARR